MKNIKIIILIALLVYISNSCNFLDVVPDDVTIIDDAFKSEGRAEGSLAGLYSYQPKPNAYRYNLEVITDETAFPSGWGINWFIHKKMWSMNFGVTSTGFNYWSDGEADTSFKLYEAIRNCHVFLEKIDKAPIPDEKKIKWKAEARFLIGYYHFLLFRVYGPIVCADKEVGLNESNDVIYAKRRSIDESVDFIAGWFNSAYPDLPSSNEFKYIGKPTKSAAKALLARLYLYAASPFFNNYEGISNSARFNMFKNYAGPDGNKLFPQSYDKEKWKKALDAYEAAIAEAHGVGRELYEYKGTKPPSWDSWTDHDKYQASNRFKIVEPWNNELIWGYSGKSDQESYNEVWHLQGPRFSKTSKSMMNCVSPTMEAAERFYTKNGLPLDQDASYDYSARYTVKVGDSTAYLHRDREPRFYSTIGFDRGRYEVQKKALYIHGRNGVNELQGKINGPDYSSTGYIIKKLVHPETTYEESHVSKSLINYPFPMIRLSELYLSYAEAYFEYYGRLDGQALNYFNLVRKRAGIPDLATSWQSHSNSGTVPTGNALRDVIKLERINEFAYEGLFYYDARRWCDAEKYFDKDISGWNVDGATQASFYQKKTRSDLVERKFNIRFYLLPIPNEEIKKNYNITQNPGWI